MKNGLAFVPGRESSNPGDFLGDRRIFVVPDGPLGPHQIVMQRR